MRYEKRKNGRKIDAIRFIVRPRTSNKETNFFKIKDKLIYEQEYNKLIKGDITKEEILEHQADMIINKKIEI